MQFHSPWAFLLLLIIPLIIFRHFKKGRTGSLRFPSLGNVKRVSPPLIFRFRHLPLFLRLLVLVLLIIGLARPQKGKEMVRQFSRGVAIEMVVDRSGSMGAEMEFGGRVMSRLDAVKEVFSRFVFGDGGSLRGRHQDLVGLVSFARYADTVCPLTLAHDTLGRFLEQVRVVPEKSPENRTAIGDAVALAAARLRTAERDLARQTGGKAGDYTIKSKIIILLTDGENNAGRRSPAQAAKLAADWGIKIYTIGVGGEIVSRVDTLFGRRMVRTRTRVDEEGLRRLAEITGGAFFPAEDENTLRRAYEEIDKLEKSEVESVRFLDYKEYFQPLALAALVLLALEAALRGTLLRRV